MGEAVNDLDLLTRTWYEAHTVLREYLEQYVANDVARTLASRACSVWVQSAADGNRPQRGPYAYLYTCAIVVLQENLGMGLTIAVCDLEVAIPVSTELLPYQLAKLFTDVWKAGQLLSWDRKTIHRAAKGLSKRWPDSPSTWCELVGDEMSPLVLPLARRAVAVLSEHQCLDCQICGEAAVRWEEDDQRTEVWNANQRLARQG